MQSDIIITNINKLNPKHNEKHTQYEFDKYAVTDSGMKYEVTGAFQGNQSVVAFYSIPPGKSNYPFHYHTTNEEVFYIIKGEGILETISGETRVSAGDVFVCPVGEKGAHKLTNASSTDDLVYLDVDTNNTPDIAFYPHSNKIGIRAAGGIRHNFDLDSNVDYFKGE